MGESSQEQQSVTAHDATDENTKQPLPSNGGSGSTGIDSIQGGTIPGATSGANQQKSAATSSTTHAQGEGAQQTKASTAPDSHSSSQTKDTAINSDNASPVFDGDTAG